MTIQSLKAKAIAAFQYAKAHSVLAASVSWFVAGLFVGHAL